jgi:two-component system, sensor histidine kinase and response regulator
MENHSGEIPIFDRLGLLETVGGDEAILEDLVRLFLDDMPGEIGLFMGAIERGDLTEAKGLAHKLKGACRNMRAFAIGEVFFRFEEVIKSGNTNGIDELIPQVENGFMEFQRAFSALD